MFENITLYHKSQNGYIPYNLIVSIRDSKTFTRTQTNQEVTNSILIRIFDKYNDEYEVSKGDIVVKGIVYDDVSNDNPITDLREIYGKENVFSVNFIKYNRFDTELDHIRIELI